MTNAPKKPSLFPEPLPRNATAELKKSIAWHNAMNALNRSVGGEWKQTGDANALCAEFHPAIAEAIRAFLLFHNIVCTTEPTANANLESLSIASDQYRRVNEAPSTIWLAKPLAETFAADLQANGLDVKAPSRARAR